MGATRHEKSFVTYDKPYEQNIIGFKGIVYFSIGLFLLIVITFGLMWALLEVLRDQAAEGADPRHPLAMSEGERLPPEPRLQIAPGWKVDTAQGEVRLELTAPQSEYRILRKEWEQIWQHGVADPHSGARLATGIEEAKQAFLSQNPKAVADPAAEALLKDSRKYITDSSSGRMATATIR
ncbi:MAG: hypothetical protein ACK4S4_10890 [Pyrinomonadaceae bacterium]